MGKRIYAISQKILLGLRLCRPRHWVKNLLVFVAPVLAHRFEFDLFFLFFAFCLAGSVGYIVNDLWDAKKDISDPRKPLANFLTEQPQFALKVLVVLVPLYILLWSWQTLAYLLLSLSYTFFFKRFALLGAFIVSAGFVWRAFAGAEFVKAEVSEWFLVTVFFVALFMATGKKLPGLSDIFLSVTLVVYVLYAFSPQTEAKFGKSMFWTIPTVTYGLLLYWSKLQANYNDPITILFTWPFLGVVAVYVVQIFLILHV